MTVLTLVHLHPCRQLEVLKVLATMKVDSCQSILARVRTTVLTFVHLYPCKHFELIKARPTIKVNSSCQSGSSRDCQTRKSRASHSFRVRCRRRHIGLSLSIAPAFLPSKREIVGFDACYDAEDVLARALDVFCCCKATRTESLGGEGAVTLYRFLQNLLARGIPARHHRENWSNFGHEDTHRK